jgi:ppGpp synthetase/RelA/SpoT-type nucleotidyltranferase
MNIKIGHTEQNIISKIADTISEKLGLVGIFNRLFYRIKPINSITKKLESKQEYYEVNNKKMQDAFGLRVTVYFVDDLAFAVSLVKQIFQELPDSHSIDALKQDQFGPQRMNLVFKIPTELKASSYLFEQPYIDDTFEVQFRTIYSEGWHEVEHDFRYKCKADWRTETELHRTLNGILATLETCDWATLKIFDELSHTKYKQLEWSSFFRNALRIRFEDDQLGQNIQSVLSQNTFIAKSILKKDRIELLNSLLKVSTRLPLKMDNVMFTINRGVLNFDQIRQLEPSLITEILDNSF